MNHFVKLLTMATCISITSLGVSVSLGYAEAFPSVDCDAPGASLQTKINNSAEGATIFFGGACDDGPYEIAGKDINLRGFSSGGTLSAPGGDCVLRVSFANVGLSRLDVDATSANDGICVFGGSAEIVDVEVRNSDGNGIIATAGSVAVISASRIIDNAVLGIGVSNGASVEINGSLIENSGSVGIALNNGGHAVILGNTININADDGVAVLGSSSAEIQENTITGNGGSGVSVGRHGSVAFPDTGGAANLIEGNSFHGVRCDQSGSLRVDLAPDFGAGNVPTDELIELDCHYP